MNNSSKTSRKIVYVLGAGFSFGTNHRVPVGKHWVEMPLQSSLFEQLCKFHYRRIKELDNVARVIRRYFNPATYRTTRRPGSHRHQDLFELSVEEIITFLDEARRENEFAKNDNDIDRTLKDLQELTVSLISYMSCKGNPGQNKLLRRFADRLLLTDVVISFNWDTLLDRIMFNRKKAHWHPAYGYGKTVSKHFKYAARSSPKSSRKYPRILKLHGSVNWLARGMYAENHRTITRDWGCGNKPAHVVMIPPKMIKPEVWGRNMKLFNNSVHVGNDSLLAYFYPELWKEAEQQLATCRSIVFIGYSFPPADFAVGNMLRRAISTQKVTTGQFPEIEIVDPHAPELARRFAQSFKISIPTDHQHLSLKNYLYSERSPGKVV